MIQDAIDQIPLDRRFHILYTILGVAIAAAFFGLGYWGRHTYVTNTRVVKVEKSWGHPSQSVPADQVSPQLAQLGLTVCDWYPGKHALVCH